MTNRTMTILSCMTLLTYSPIEAQTLYIVSGDGGADRVQLATTLTDASVVTLSTTANARDFSAEAKPGETLESGEAADNSVALPSTTRDVIPTVTAENPVAKASQKVEAALEAGKTIRFDGVLFEHDKATLRPASDADISAVADALKARPALRVRIEGHTDDEGSSDYNQRLSVRRAKAVAAALVARGVPEANLMALGFGLSRPVATNSTPEGRAQNRRVDVVPIE